MCATHPTDNELYALAQKLLAGEELSSDEEVLLIHLADCKECYAMFACLAAVLGVTNNIAHLVRNPEEAIQALEQFDAPVSTN